MIWVMESDGKEVESTHRKWLLLHKQLSKSLFLSKELYSEVLYGSLLFWELSQLTHYCILSQNPETQTPKPRIFYCL